MAAAYDNSTEIGRADGGANTLTSSAFAVAGGAGSYLVVGVLSHGYPTYTPTGAKWGGASGTAMTLEETISMNNYGNFTLFTLANPTAQTSTVYVTYDGNATERALIAISVTGVSGKRTYAKASATDAAGPATVNATTVADDLVVDVVMQNNWSVTEYTLTVGANQASREELEGTDIGGYHGMGGSTEVATGTTTTMSWTISGTPKAWGIFAVPLIPAAAGGIVRQMMMYHGG